MNEFGSLRISVRKSRISAWRDQTELAAVDDTSGKPLPLVKGSLTSLCWCFGLKGLAVTDAAGEKVWEDNFDTNTSALSVAPFGRAPGRTRSGYGDGTDRRTTSIASCRARWGRS